VRWRWSIWLCSQKYTDSNNIISSFRCASVFTTVLYSHQGIVSIYTNSSALKLFSLWAKVFSHTYLPGNDAVPIGSYRSFGGAWRLHIQRIFVKKRSESLKSPVHFKLVRLYCFSLIASYYKCGVTETFSSFCYDAFFFIAGLLLFFINPLTLR